MSFNDHMTHNQLVERAAKWLRKKYPVVVTEMVSQGEEPDAIGFAGGFSTLIECKASRADYLSEKRKRYGHRRIGMGDFKYYLTPHDLVKPEELPEGWGLMYVSGKGVKIVVEAPQIYNKDHRSEQGLLLSCIRRLGPTSPEGVSVRFYTYMKGNKKRATLGVAL